jgi:hypothetical protein
MPNNYAEQADFESYVVGWTTTTDVASLNKVIQLAERDIDFYCGPWSIESNGRKFGSPNASSGATNPKALTDNQKRQLKNATCAQAYFRILNGEEWMMQTQPQSVSGPDFSSQGARAKFSPQAKLELADSGLVRRSARIYRWSGRSSPASNVQ